MGAEALTALAMLSMSKAYTLSRSQQAGLASIIELAGESDDNEEPGMEAERRACVIELVRLADAAFTAEATKSEVEVMWSVDEGLDDEAVSSLRRRVAKRLVVDEPVCGAALGAASEASALRRAAHALANSCLSGRSAHFKLEQSVADQFVDLVGPLRFWTSVAAVLVLAIGGACAALDWLIVENVLGPRGDYRPCQCKLCEGRVALGAKIGAGGFGAVWRCKDPAGTVLKVVKIDLERDVNALRIALDEAKHLLELRHTHVVAYLDMWVHREGEDGRLSRSEDIGQDADDSSFLFNRRTTKAIDYACIAMEDCDGGTLLDHVANGVPLPLDVVRCVVKQCADALEYAHAVGIVHRDIKLENIFVKLVGANAAVVKIGDFGLAVKTNDESAVAGTETYQPPECFADDPDANPTGPPVDAWGLGCALYEMTTCVSLPSDPPFLGQLVLDDPKDLGALATRFEDALDVAAVADAARKDETAVTANDRRATLEGLRALLRHLLAPDARLRPTLYHVNHRPFLQLAVDHTLDFFVYAARREQGVFGHHATNDTNAPSLGRKNNHITNRALRAKSMAQHAFQHHHRGRHAGPSSPSAPAPASSSPQSLAHTGAGDIPCLAGEGSLAIALQQRPKSHHASPSLAS